MKGMGKKGAKGASKGRFVNPQVLEAQFEQQANDLFGALMDWNASPADLSAGWDQVMALRSAVMQAYGAQAQSAVPGQAGGGGDAAQINWKGDLIAAVSKQNKINPSKDFFQFDTVEVATGGYVSTVSCEALSRAYKGTNGKSKKEAEHLAAKAAMQANFPQRYRELSGGAPAGPVPQGQKRKAAEIAAPAPEANFKQQLMQAATLLKGESLLKGEVEYESAEVEGGGFVGTVTLKAYDPNTGYQGHPGANKKLAEDNAAEAALSALADVIAPLQEEHLAKKKAKNQESLAALKQRQQEKKQQGQGQGLV